jgi:hypothetical protein
MYGLMTSEGDQAAKVANICCVEAKLLWFLQA